MSRLYGIRWVLLVAALVAAALVAACGAEATPTPTPAPTPTPIVVEKEVLRVVTATPTPAPKPAKVYEWRLTASLGATDPFTQREVKMVERIKERTNGALSITSFPSDTLMKSVDVPKEITRRTIELDAAGMVFYGTISDIAALLVPGFVGVATRDTLKVLEPGKEGRTILDDHFAGLGIKPLAFWDQVDIGMTTFDPLNTVASFKGKKLRTSGELSSKIFRAIGAEPTIMGGAEAVDAMRRKIIDGSTCQPTCILSRGYQDFAKYYNPWTVIPNLGMLVVNIKAWNDLPADLQKVLQEEAAAAAKDMTELVSVTQGQAMWRLTNEFGLSLLAIERGETEKVRNIAVPIFDEFVRNAKPQPQASRMFQLLLEESRKR